MVYKHVTEMSLQEKHEYWCGQEFEESINMRCYLTYVLLCILLTLGGASCLYYGAPMYGLEAAGATLCFFGVLGIVISAIMYVEAWAAVQRASRNKAVAMWYIANSDPKEICKKPGVKAPPKHP